MTLFDRALSVPAEAAIMLGFGVLMMAIAVVNFRSQE
jgi:hypothetical protein